MALPILDGNQSATTLSTILSGGEHTPAHTVVSLGSTAISNITSAVSGSVVSISNFPSTQTIAGTVTANSAEVVSIVNTTTVTKADAKFSLIAGANNPTDVASAYSITPLDVDIKGVAFVDGKVVSHRNSCVAELAGQGGPAWKANLVASSVTVSNSVTIGSLPAISGTVTAGNLPLVPWDEVIDSGFSVPVKIKQTGEEPVSISGTVTVGAMPSGALTTRFGSVTTANTAQLTSAVTNTSRKYLLIQNVTTGSNVITVGIGFTPTTTQGIQLTAGAGITFESSYIPTGAVYVLSSVTASNFTVLEA